MGRIYFFLLVAIGIMTSMASNLGGSTPSSGGDEEVRLAAHSGSQSNSGSETPPGTVELQREPDGHFYANVEINGMPIRVLVDTGASAIALSRDDARRAGLPVSAAMFDVVGQGASGEVHGQYVTLDKVALGSAEARSVPAVVLDGGEQSLLGQSFLSEFDKVEIDGDRMLLR